MLIIPFIGAPVVCCVLGYFATTIGILPAPIGIYPPFGTPIFALGFIEGSWKLALAQLILIPICMLIYYPFFRMLDKQAVGRELEAQADLEKKSNDGVNSSVVTS
ncbi:Lichenan permease IIC component [compost metagenome]